MTDVLFEDDGGGTGEGNRTTTTTASSNKVKYLLFVYKYSCGVLRKAGVVVVQIHLKASALLSTFTLLSWEETLDATFILTNSKS